MKKRAAAAARARRSRRAGAAVRIAVIGLGAAGLLAFAAREVPALVREIKIEMM